jgi:dihydroneopterin aldolase
MESTITIAGLELRTSIGITAGERLEKQRVKAWLVLVPTHGVEGLEDEITKTVDYIHVCEAAREVAGEGARNLIETLAEDLAVVIMARFPVMSVEVEIRKYVIADAEYAAVRIRRER